MATKGKDGTLGKEKRGTSPSNAHHIRVTSPSNAHHKRPSPKQSAPDQSLDKDHSTPSEKQVPHYLKPTISSLHLEPTSKYVKKHGPAAENPSQKPSLNRRASFDKPPSASQLQKVLSSPSPRERTIRSSSTSSTKPISERTALKSTHKVVKSQPSLSRPKSLKKSTSLGIKKETNNPANAKAKPPSISDDHIIESLNNEPEPEDKDLLINSEVEEELAKVESEVDFPHEIPVPENKEHVDVEDSIDPKNHEDEKLIKSCETSTVSEDQNAPPVAEVEETHEDKTDDHEEITNDNIHHVEEKEINKEESENSHPEESSAVDQPKVIESEAKEGEEEGETDKNLKGKTNSEYKEEVEEGISQRLKSKEGENQAEGSIAEEEAKPPAAENVAVKRQAGGQGKKDSPAYNDVIEETASKLLEKRKNKVSALVGAFETVISLQEPEGGHT